jgi:hypothetical protein
LDHPGEATVSEMPPPASSPLPKTPGQERRASIRFYSRQAISAVVNKSWTAKVRDVSTAGIGLILSQPIGVNLIGEVELSNEDQSLTYTLPIRVVHVTDQRNGTWLIGCVFGRPLREEELNALL